MVKLEQFLLKQLKDIFNYVKLKYNILNDFKIYQLNKFDIIVIMRNSNYFDASDYNDLICLVPNSKTSLLFKPTGLRLYRGEKQKEGVIFHTGKVVLNFD